MSYIRAHKVSIESGVDSEDGYVSLELPDHDATGRPDIDNNLDDEMLSFVLKLIKAIDELPEGEALIVWKVVF